MSQKSNDSLITTRRNKLRVLIKKTLPELIKLDKIYEEETQFIFELKQVKSEKVI